MGLVNLCIGAFPRVFLANLKPDLHCILVDLLSHCGTSLNNPMGKLPIKGKGPKGKYRPTRENGQTGD